MSGHPRTIAAAVVLAVLVIGFVVYRNEHHSPTCTGCGMAIPVLVAQRQIQRGTPGNVIADTDLYKVVPLARSEVETGAYVDPRTLNGEVAVKDIYPGEQLTAAEFAPSSPSIVSGPLNQRAVVIKPTSPTGQIAAGSHVDVWVATNKHGSTYSILHELFQDLYVLHVSTSGAVTLRVTPRQGGTLLYASHNDRLVIRLHRTVSR